MGGHLLVRWLGGGRGGGGGGRAVKVALKLMGLFMANNYEGFLKFSWSKEVTFVMGALLVMKFPVVRYRVCCFSF